MAIEIGGKTAKAAYNQILIAEAIHVAVKLIAHHEL
jgi:hypothetical protein